MPSTSKEQVIQFKSSVDTMQSVLVDFYSVSSIELNSAIIPYEALSLKSMGISE